VGRESGPTSISVIESVPTPYEPWVGGVLVVAGQEFFLSLPPCSLFDPPEPSF